MMTTDNHMEGLLDTLLKQAYAQETIDIYTVAATAMGNDAEVFAHVRPWVHQLVKSKLAAYVDEECTELKITNYGRYWVVRGGYMVYLKEEHELKEKRSHDKEMHQEKLLEARLKLTHYRLLGFWVALVVSALGLALSVFNLFLFLKSQQH